jgi:hypothetical protein
VLFLELSTRQEQEISVMCRQKRYKLAYLLPTGYGTVIWEDMIIHRILGLHRPAVGRARQQGFPCVVGASRILHEEVPFKNQE